MYKVSVIIPVYNAEKYLKKCIDSVLSQTLKEIEIILVDDGSTDNSINILDEYDKNFKNIKVIHQQNSGPAKARNVGIENATGKYIGFVDSDDYLSNDMYETLYNIATQNNIDIVTGDYFTVNAGNQTTSSHFKMPSNQIIYKDEIHNLITHANESRILWFAGKGIYKNKIIKDNKITYPPLKLGEETLFVLDCMLSAESMYYINKPFYYYEQTPNSLTRTKHKENLLQQLEGLYVHKKEIYEKHNFNLYHNDLNIYTMKHSLPLLLSNELSNKDTLLNKIKLYKNIRNSEMINTTYKSCSVNLINSKIKYLAILLKYRMYILLALISK